MSITLLCLVKDNATADAFSVKISRDEPISELKKAIKAEKAPEFDHFPAGKLKLWQVQIGGDQLEDQLKNLELKDSEELSAINEIGEYWIEKPPKKHIHVLVEPPATTLSQQLARRVLELEEKFEHFYGKPDESLKREYGYEAEQKENVKKIRIYPSPSSFALINSMRKHQVKDKAFLIGRPYGCVGAPLVLYNSVFSEFKRNYNNEELSMDDKHYKWTLKIIELMANFYVDEGYRERAFHEEIRKLFGQDISKVQLEDQTSNDGILTLDFYTFTVLLILAEIKNEIGTGSCDPTTQAAVSYAKFYVQQKNERLLEGCNMPCFIISLAGPWICVLGAVYVEKPIVEPLTAFEPLISTYDRTHILKVARLFRALRLGVDKLKDYYSSLPPTTTYEVDLQRFYPYPHEANNVGEFFYTERLFDEKLLWKAETKEGSQIVVKYAHKYNKTAHELCFGIKKAPRLFSVEKMSCGFYCVIMEYIEGRRLSECTDLKRSEYNTIIEEIENAISLLHSNNIVFADLRDSNILVFKGDDGEHHGMLVDFDWAGVNNTDSYPPLMNPNINWPTGARDCMPLNKEHDIYWLNFLKNLYLGNYEDK